MSIRVMVVETRKGPNEPRIETLEMAAVPRIGDAFAWDPDEAAFTVKSVIWVAHNTDHDVQVRGW